MSARRRVGNVDVLRAVAALCVLAVHAYALGGRGAPIKAQHWYDVPLVNLSTGVWLFFAISGYVISKPFVDRLLAGTAPPATRAYALRRALRIFPLYWLVLTVLIAIEGTAGTRPWQLVVHYLLLNNLVPGRQEALFPAAWTLSLEVLFYIAVPVVAWLLSRRARRPWSAERLSSLVILSFLASALFTVIADLQGDGQIGLWLRGSLPAMWLMFCPGILLAIAPHLTSPWWRRWVVDFPATRWAAGVVLLSVVAGAMLGADAPLRFGIVPYQLLVDASHPLFAIGYGLIVAAALRARPWAGGAGWLLTLGVVSYGIYLIHPVIEAFVLKEGFSPVAHDNALAFVVNTACLAALTIPLALVSWRFVEQPAIELGRRLAGRWSGRTSSTINPVPASEIRAEVGGEQIREFWNERAREDAFYFVDTRQRYRAPEPERFWQSTELVDYLFDGLGVRLRETDTVLEIGCGIGRITRDLAARAQSVIAVDVSDEMLARASALNPQLAAGPLAPRRRTLADRRRGSERGCVCLGCRSPARPRSRDHPGLRPRGGSRAAPGRLGRPAGVQ